jgi:hypothetical protein
MDPPRQAANRGPGMRLRAIRVTVHRRALVALHCFRCEKSEVVASDLLAKGYRSRVHWAIFTNSSTLRLLTRFAVRDQSLFAQGRVGRSKHGCWSFRTTMPWLAITPKRAGRGAGHRYHARNGRSTVASAAAVDTACRPKPTPPASGPTQRIHLRGTTTKILLAVTFTDRGDYQCNSQGAKLDTRSWSCQP